MQKAAFFDIDKTLYSGTLAEEFAKQLKLNPTVPGILKEEELTLDIGTVELLVALRDSGKMPYRAYLEAVEKTFALVEGVFNTWTLSLFKELRRKGYCMVALSQAPFSLLKKYSEHIDGDSFDVVVSPMPVIENNKEMAILGDRSLISTKERDKGQWVEKLAECYGFDLSLSMAIGDSVNDAPMISKVGGRKIAFSPDNELRSIAESKGWEIIEKSTKFKK